MGINLIGVSVQMTKDEAKKNAAEIKQWVDEMMNHGFTREESVNILLASFSVSTKCVFGNLGESQDD